MIRRLLPVFLGVCVLACLLPCALRDLWFDEALTVLQFANLPDCGTIYRSYVIPNNQIIHTILLHLYMQFVPPANVLLRMFPVVTAILTVLVIFCSFRKICGTWPLIAVLAAWILSPAFAIYGTALRGYMLSALWITLALKVACNAAEYGRKRDFAAWALVSLLAVGTIPTNLLGLGAAVLYALPLFSKDFYRKRGFWRLAVTPFLMLALFYLPILPQFLGCCRLREGWSDGLAAITASMLPLASAFLILLIPAARGAWIAVKRQKIYGVRGLLWLLIPAVCLTLPVAPFPRTFFPLWPVYVVLLASGLKHFTAAAFRIPHKACAGAILFFFAAVLCGNVVRASDCKQWLSGFCGGENGDDLVNPYYMTNEFSPSGILLKLRELDPERRRQLYCSFCADPWSILFAALQNGLPAEYVLFDGPARKVSALPDGTFVLLRHDEDPAALEQRFHGRLSVIGHASKRYRPLLEFRTE